MTPLPVPQGWMKLIELCKKIQYGEIDKLKIQDGVPVLMERVIEKTKL